MSEAPKEPVAETGGAPEAAPAADTIPETAAAAETAPETAAPASEPASTPAPEVRQNNSMMYRDIPNPPVANRDRTRSISRLRSPDTDHERHHVQTATPTASDPGAPAPVADDAPAPPAADADPVADAPATASADEPAPVAADAAPETAPETAPTPETVAIATPAPDPVSSLVAGALTKAAEATPEPAAAKSDAASTPAPAPPLTPGAPSAPAPTPEGPIVAPSMAVTPGGLGTALAAAAAEKAAAPETPITPAPEAAAADPISSLVAGAIAKVAEEEPEAPTEQSQDAAKPKLQKQASMKDASKKVGLFGRMFGGKKKEEDKKDETRTEEKKEDEAVPSTPNPVADLVSNAIAKVEGSFGSPVDASAEAKKAEEAAPAEQPAPAAAGTKIAIQDEEEPPAPTEAPAEAPAELPAPPAPASEAPAPAAPAPEAAPAPQAAAPALPVQPPAEDILPSPVKQPHEVEMDADKADALKSGIVSALLTPGGIGNMFGGGKGGGSKATPSERRMRGGVASDDVLSVKVHSTSALIPNAILVSPVIRIHLVDSETGAPLEPSGTSTTPVQTAPFDLSRRVKASLSPEWNEQLDIEETVKDVTHPRALLLFELLQPVPSFGYYDERPDMFPNGQPAKIAWGFLKLLRSKDQKPNFGRLQVQLYKFPGEAQGLVGALTKTALNNWAASKDVVGDLAVYRTWKETIKHRPALRPLYPAHVNCTVAAAPRGAAATALLSSLKDNIKNAAALPAPGMTLKGLVTGKAIKPRPGIRDRIERERALGGGWRGAQDVLRSAPVDEAAEVTETLGRLPYETLCYGMDADAARAHQAASTPMKAAIVTAIRDGEDGPGATYEAGGRPGKPVVVKLPHARDRHDDCEIPNGEARTQVTLPGHARECVLAAFDQLGRRLAAVCKEGSMYTVQIFDMATGQCTAAFAGHASGVYDLRFAPDPEVDVGASLGTVDFNGGAPTRVITASADGAARAWSVGADVRNPSREQLGSDDAVAQHACECYGAAWHPQRPELAATVARDGGVRLWNMPWGQGSRSVPAQGSVVTGIAPGQPGVAATALTFDKGGHRVFVGFADGSVREMLVELGQDVLGAGARTGAGAQLHPTSSVRPLRECRDMLGEAVTCIRATPNDRRVLVRTIADRIAAVEVSFFAATHSLDLGKPGLKLRHAKKDGAAQLARFGVSPDGRYVVAPAADGSTRLFDVDIGGDGVRMPAAENPGVRVNDVAWSPAAHVVCVASADPRRPVGLKANVEGRPNVQPPTRGRNAAAMLGRPGAPATAAAIKKSREAAGFTSSSRGRGDALPVEMTPDAVREMLQRIRVDGQRERSQQKEDFQRQRQMTPRGANPTAVTAPATGGYRGQRAAGGVYGQGQEKENAAGVDVTKSFDPYNPGAAAAAAAAPGGEFGLSSMGFGAGAAGGGSSAGAGYGLGSELGTGALSSLSPVG